MTNEDALKSIKLDPTRAGLPTPRKAVDDAKETQDPKALTTVFVDGEEVVVKPPPATSKKQLKAAPTLKNDGPAVTLKDETGATIPVRPRKAPDDFVIPEPPTQSTNPGPLTPQGKLFQASVAKMTPEQWASQYAASYQLAEGNNAAQKAQSDLTSARMAAAGKRITAANAQARAAQTARTSARLSQAELAQQNAVVTGKDSTRSTARTLAFFTRPLAKVPFLKAIPRFFARVADRAYEEGVEARIERKPVAARATDQTHIAGADVAVALRSVDTAREQLRILACTAPAPATGRALALATEQAHGGLTPRNTLTPPTPPPTS